MKESYSEILARCAGPESYADGGNTVGVVTAGVHPGPDIELRKQAFPECRHLRSRGRQLQTGRYWRDLLGLGGVEDPEHGWKLQTREPGDPTRLSEEVADSGPKTPPEVTRT
jgi:hypothetical protein